MEVKEKLKERFGETYSIEEVEDCFISLVYDNEEVNREMYYKYLEMK